MIRKLLLTIVLGFCMFGVAHGQDPKLVTHLTLPMPTGVTQPGDDPDLKNLVWNRFQSDKYTILSLNADQGKYLFSNIRKMQTWAMTRWGIPDQDLTVECRVLCVPSKNLMKKLFNLEQSHYEVRRNKEGKVEQLILWIVLDGTPAETVPMALTAIASADLGIPFWAQRGMSVLNGTIPQIRTGLGSLNGPLNTNQTMFWSKAIFTMTEEGYKKESQEKRDLFDQESAALCLMIRKEFGQTNFVRVVKSTGGETALKDVLGFDSYSQMDATYTRYMGHLASDIVQNKTPNSYLQIEKATR